MSLCLSIIDEVVREFPGGLRNCPTRTRRIPPEPSCSWCICVHRSIRIAKRSGIGRKNREYVALMPEWRLFALTEYEILSESWSCPTCSGTPGHDGKSLECSVYSLKQLRNLQLHTARWGRFISFLDALLNLPFQTIILSRWQNIRRQSCLFPSCSKAFQQRLPVISSLLPSDSLCSPV